MNRKMNITRHEHAQFNAIKQAVCEAWYITPDELDTRSRTYRYVLPREQLVYLARRYTYLSYPDLARLLKRHHTTLMSNHRKARQRMNGDEDYKRKLDTIIETLNENPLFGKPPTITPAP